MPNYRQLHEESLAQNQAKRYRDLQRSGELKAHLDALEKDAKDLHAQIVKDLRQSHPFNPVEWKNEQRAWEAWLHRSAKEVVLNDLVLVPDRETEQAMRDGYVD